MSPRVVPTATPELLQERLYARLVPDPETGCRLWTGKTDFGYGRIKICGQLRYVHCVVWELEVGAIPDGMDLDHVYDRGCRYRRCALIAHLEPVTRKENVRRKLSLRASGVRMDPAACDLRTAWMIGYRARQRAEAGRVAAELVKAS